ncbi:MAG: hypothetical protein OXG60_16755 [Chloroflexi bacterium]|nr:hypothetical protein [Chloroflexota bacterium]
MSTILDPTGELQPARRERLPRLPELAGKTVGLLDISKPRGDVFLDRLEQHLGAGGIAVRRYQKPTFTRIAPADLKFQIARDCDVVIEALAD